jgi:Ca-activated chloride channel family protein
VSFADPYYLVVLVLVPITAIAYVLLSRRRAKRATGWSRPPLQPNIVSRPSRGLALIPPALFLVGLSFLLVGFARPQRERTRIAQQSGPTIVLAFDVSGSMAARDVQQMRLRAAREVAIRLVKRLPSTYQVAVVTFGNKARVAVSPTLDRNAVISRLPRTITPLSGTSIGDGISSAVSLIIHGFQQGEPVDRLHPLGSVVVFSDGAQTGGGTTPDDAASAAYVWAVPINSVIVGTSHGFVTQPLKVSGFRTSIDMAVPISPVSLQRASQLTGGASFEARTAADVTTTAKKLLMAVRQQGLKPLTRSRPGEQELSSLAGLVGLGFVLGGIVLSGLWFGRLA